ncbi:MAG: translation initiation factor IF-2 [Candidatus Marsarchaeota archaeon]|nr:translation initiation factor IF-2 [Candidatus Marsarchaeota archaeon]
MIRQPIISVMGHVDHGKTTLLDKIRSTTVAAREAGRITQHIGASEVPIKVIRDICGPMLNSFKTEIAIPGLLFIDTPGHEAFTNLRKRGGSVSDMAIVVVDITKGFEPQTIEAIEILRNYKTPFIIAANKIDLITGWNPSGSYSISEAMKKQRKDVVDSLNNKIFETEGRLSEFGFSSDLFLNVKDFQKELAIVPVSAKTGEGVAEILMLVAGLSQRFLEMKLNIEVNGPGKGSILERKEVKGLGTTIDVILYDGTLHVNDMIAFATEDKVSTAKIRALLKPRPLKEIREAGGYDSVQSVSAASGVKISATGLDGALPGSPLLQILGGEDYTTEIKAELGDVFETDKKGPILKTDSIGSMEAISKLLKAEGFQISRKGLGNVSKRDVSDAFAMNAEDSASAVILAFNVGAADDAVAEASLSGIKIIRSNVIYSLVDEYKGYAEERKRNRMQETESRIVMPGKIEVLRDSCFRVSDPAIFGVSVLSGKVRKGYAMMNEEGEAIGRIKGLQHEKEPRESAAKGESIAMSMDGPVFGRNIKEGQILYTRVTYDDERLLRKEFSYLLDEEGMALLDRIVEIGKKKEKRQ